MRVLVFFLWLLAGQRGGATAVAYGLLVALMAVVIVAATNTVGSDLSYLFANTANSLSLTPPVEPTPPAPP